MTNHLFSSKRSRTAPAFVLAFLMATCAPAIAQQFNSAVLKCPANIVANLFGFKPKAYFRGVAGSSTPPEVNFQPFGNPQPAPAPK